MPSKFVIKRLFESNTHTIVEIKLQLAEETDSTPEQLQWLYLEKTSGALIKLWLRSRDSSPAIEERYFEQGYLKFNKQQATFIEKFNSAQYTLDRKQVDKPERNLVSLIDHYLS